MGIMNPSLQLWIALIAGLCCQSSGQNVPQVETTISTPKKGENFTVQCTVTVAEPDNYVLIDLHIDRKDSGNATSDINLVTLVSVGSLVIINVLVKDRMTFDTLTSTLTVTNAACGDERGVYECQQFWINANTGAVDNSQDSKPLRLKVPPGPVSMAGNVPLALVEGESLSVTCTANVGRGDKGRIVWTVVSTGGVREIVDLEEGLVSDERIASTERSGDPSCNTVIEESIFNLTKLDRSRQGLVVGCYVVNEDYRPAVPSSCEFEFCKETDVIYIHYPASVPVITLAPMDPVEGGSVTFRCTSDAMPPATYTWSMGNTTFLTGVVDQGVSRLTLDDLHLANDMGEYMCEARNEVQGVEHSVNGTISLTIAFLKHETTTETTTDRESGNIFVWIIGFVGGFILATLAALIVTWMVIRRKKSSENTQTPETHLEQTVLTHDDFPKEGHRPQKETLNMAVTKPIESNDSEEPKRETNGTDMNSFKVNSLSHISKQVVDIEKQSTSVDKLHSQPDTVIVHNASKTKKVKSENSMHVLNEPASQKVKKHNKDSERSSGKLKTVDASKAGKSKPGKSKPALKATSQKSGTHNKDSAHSFDSHKTSDDSRTKKHKPGKKKA